MTVVNTSEVENILPECPNFIQDICSFFENDDGTSVIDKTPETNLPPNLSSGTFNNCTFNNMFDCFNLI